MIQTNVDDNYVGQLVKDSLARISAEKYKKDLSNLNSMLVYGVASGKGYDLVIHSSFKNSDKLIKLIISKAPRLNIYCGVVGDLSWAQEKRIGLGYQLRKNDQELCKKLIIAAYLCMNDLLDFEN